MILSSGQAPEHIAAQASQLGSLEILRKPFDLDEAVAVVRSLVTARAIEPGAAPANRDREAALPVEP
jgi:DNA-binding NtrC family response regulator